MHKNGAVIRPCGHDIRRPRMHRELIQTLRVTIQHMQLPPVVGMKDMHAHVRHACHDTFVVQAPGNLLHLSVLGRAPSPLLRARRPCLEVTHECEGVDPLTGAVVEVNCLRPQRRCEGSKAQSSNVAIPSIPSTNLGLQNSAQLLSQSE